ncbi:MAG: 23S rRNA (uracil(1939)-C(5))-methyltransferase RlmD [Acidobacteriota bacterium]|nr:23S rRNA (uracil(1939)-C(5))-methyltransferase RlmD [Acidobacteriota bacterium]
MRLEIDRMVYGGAGLARNHEASGQTVQVPFTLPGEQIEACLTGPTEASLLQVLTPSESRVAPNCAHFGQCGGCHYQHASYPAQIETKSAILRDSLHQAGLQSLPSLQLHTANPWHYRNRTRMRVESLHGKLHVGYNRRATNAFLPIHKCPISAPLILQAAEALLQISHEPTPSGRWTHGMAEVEFFTTPGEEKLQMLTFLRKREKTATGFTAFCEQMSLLIPQLTGAGSFLLTGAAGQRRQQKARPLSHWRAGGLVYPAAGEDYWISRGGFFQVNRFLIDELVNTVVHNRQGDLAWDLYAGVGLFSRALSRGFPRVVAVEAAASDLVNTFKGQGRLAVASNTHEFLRSAMVQRERPQLVVVDPPRSGIGADVSNLLGRLAPAEIVYVSCDPVSLGRDLAILTAGGYSLSELHLFDLFPQTFHIETVAVLRRDEPVVW